MVLNIVYDMVRKHIGEIDEDSTVLKGTTFILRPISEKHIMNLQLENYHGTCTPHSVRR